jgi:aspartyl-tRNA(Asn)/glutamyl-tRNA(Gln) amidotransferase subunit A
LKRFNSLSEVKKELSENKLSCVELVTYYLQNIEAKKHLNAFLQVYRDEALAAAKLVDEKLKSGKAGRLAGMVIGIKDVISHQGHGLQAASQILTGFQAQFNATVVERLLKEDAIIIGRQNCDEFAMGSSNENSSFGPVLNDADNTRVPGGSSGGSAVAVQADLCLASLGSDTGGSVRQPASFCGVYGLKPTYSRISRWGLVAYASSFDSIGIFSRSVDDSALLLEIIAGADEYDSTVSFKEVEKYSAGVPLPKKLKIGYLKDGFNEAVNTEVKAQTRQAIEKLASQGHELTEVELPFIDYILPTYYILTTAEASSNLSRFDGVRYGRRTKAQTDLLGMYKKSRSEGFGKEVQKRIMLGTFVLSASYYDAYYTKAQKVRRLIKEKTDELLSTYDFILMPTSPTTAFKLNEFTSDPLAMYLADVFTVQANLAGIPAISIPNGVDSNGLGIGLQIITGSFKENQLLSFSAYLSNLN